MQRRLALWAWLFLIPALAGFVLIVVYPFLYALWMSLHDWPVLGTKEFIWFDNYTHMLRDPLFWKSLRITLIWTMGVVPATIATGLVVALLLNNDSIRGKEFFRTVYFIPVMTNMVAASFVWRWLFEPTNGVINYGIHLLGVTSKPGWLADTDWALIAMMVVAVWKQIGFAMVILLAGLQTVPRFIYEAAELDGTNRWQKFWHITLPLINPTIVFLVVMMVINALRVFTIPYVMSAGGFTNQAPGGPLDSTRVFALHIYDLGFRRFDLGYSAANSFALMLLILAVTLVQMKVLQRNFEY
ncbi:MAG: sugar ABC transporter permease [Actinobacteria bacterium]|nr:sugar ABC transporter permease [Actinomycetota bacterium]